MNDILQIDKESSLWKAFIKGVKNSGEGLIPVRFNNENRYLCVRHQNMIFQFAVKKYIVEITNDYRNLMYFYVVTKNPVSVLEALAE